MAIVNEKLQDLQTQNERVVLGGGWERIEAQHKANKMTAHERLHLLFDHGFYDELFRFVKHSSTAFGLGDKELPADGVVTGLGAINRRLAYASSQDFTVMGPNVAGVLGTAIDAGVLLAIVR